MIAHLYNQDAARHAAKAQANYNCKQLTMIADLFRQDSGRHAGKVEAIYNCKQKSQGRWVEDLERGIMPKIDPYPWQTDTSIGDWFYDRNWKFRPVSWVIHMLVDNVSKNGNLLLNIVQRPDGSLDPEVESMLSQLADWNAVHSEAIFGTRPWLVYGESTVKVGGGSFKEDFKYDAREIRFTTKGATLYAIALGWPGDGQLTVRSLAKAAGENVNNITSVSLLGYKGNLEWKQSTDGLVVTLPARKVSEYTAALRIAGSNLKPIPFTVPTQAIAPNARGNFILGADDAELHGDQIKTEDHGGQSNIGFWDKGEEWASWKVQFLQAGTFKLIVSVASTSGSSQFVIEAAGQQLSGVAAQTSGWDQFKEIDIGQLEVKQPGQQEVKVRAKDAQNWQAMNLRFVKLTKAD
jgi:alpha-L-fucosidase